MSGLILVAAATVMLLLSHPRLTGADAIPGGAITDFPPAGPAPGTSAPTPPPRRRLEYQPRRPMETSGFPEILRQLRWTSDASLGEIGDNWQTAAPRAIELFNKILPPPGKSDSQRLGLLISTVNVINFQGENQKAYDLLGRTRAWIETNEPLAELGLYTIIYYQGVVALRRGETENCVDCRGESSCILPIAAAVQTNPTGSRLANHNKGDGTFEDVSDKAGDRPTVVHRHVSSGSSWGANPLEQHIGLGKAGNVATLEVPWPTSGTTQVFNDIDADQAIEVTEFALDYRKLERKRIPTPR